MKLSELPIKEGWASAFKSAGLGFLKGAAQQATGMDLSAKPAAGKDKFVQDFVSKVYRKILDGISTGRIADPTKGETKYAPGSQAGWKTPATPPTAPTAVTQPATPAATTTPAAVPKAPSQFSEPIGIPGQEKYVKGPSGWVMMKDKKTPAPTNLNKMLDQALGQVTENYTKLNRIFESIMESDDIVKAVQTALKRNKQEQDDAVVTNQSITQFLMKYVAKEIGPGESNLRQNQEIVSAISNCQQAYGKPGMKAALTALAEMVYNIALTASKSMLKLQ